MATEMTLTQTSTQALPPLNVLAAIERSLAMIEFDPQGNVLWANRNFAQAMGYEPEEMVGMHHRRFCTKEFARSADYEALWANLRSGILFQDKISRVAKDGRLLWLEATYTPIFDEAGEVQAVLKVATDITEREHNTAALTNDLLVMADQLRSRAEDGMSRGGEISQAIERIVTDSNENLNILQSLQDQAASIRGIVGAIRDIASQTNLLALNAAIEAAHAGEHGRGFNVVAGEVRKLSQQVQQATQQVESFVDGVSAHLTQMAKGTQRSQASIHDSRQRIGQAVEQFTKIGEAARLLDTQAQTLGELL